MEIKERLRKRKRREGEREKGNNKEKEEEREEGGSKQRGWRRTRRKGRGERERESERERERGTVGICPRRFLNKSLNSLPWNSNLALKDKQKKLNKGKKYKKKGRGGSSIKFLPLFIGFRARSGKVGNH